MRAIVCSTYGSPDVLSLQDVEIPSPKDNEVRIRIHAAAVTPSDCAFRKADPVIIRLMYGLTKPRYPVMGVELAGQIESVGKAVTQFKAGDEVFGISPRSFGAYAEYVCLPENVPLAVKPRNMSYEQAVGICDGALTSLVFLRDVARIERGQSLLINGASGAVGVYAIQLAAFFGADVTGVCSASNAEFVRSLGAHRVIDYTQADFTRSGRYDVIFDAVGKSSFSRCKGALQPNGIYLTTVPTPAILLRTARGAIGGGKKAKFTATGLRQNKENLLFLKELAESGAIRPVIDRRYPLEQIAEAHRYVETGRKKGNVVITM
ncbi:NAD(P)-dependent alcohol dehydrogenase [Paenibacillus methanolicus]|uniref:NADPH:quinone reductase-like Zn-dependent oxidoreductase n=1 Tax=Paenibacillus methanolicus TaxID=582686 RepID=A0A5S5BUW3_9BACL|nr:NAD(P)-dependent alcohol dehydrogenase [Paenibacillus methanolicus]TYP69373.1 NADPH:quinone reductase-like Zn-dependent oxidoreductase [Paenibacillus methanolicus]